MLGKLTYLFIAVPVAVVLIILSVANRFPVTLRLDPFNSDAPALAITLPFFVFLFAALMAGLLLGGIVTWWRQGKYRQAARKEHSDALRWQYEAEAQKQRAEELAAEKTSDVLSLPSSDRAA